MDIPEHLIDLKAAFLQAEARCAEIAAELPRAVDIASGAAELTDADRERWDSAQAEMRRLAEEIQTDPWWAGVEDAHAARTALTAAAKARLGNG